MRKIISLCIVSIIFFSCSSSKKTIVANNNATTNTTTNTSAASTTTADTPSKERDGSSYEKAIIIKENRETTGVAKEYQWLRENYPGYTSGGQALQHVNKRSYDIITIKTAEGVEKKIYFDITNFFGKW